MPDINSSQVSLTPYDETSKDKKELEASANSAAPVFWPPPYMQNAPSGQEGMDMYPFSNNYREAGNGAPPLNTVQASSPKGDDCKHKRKKLSHCLLLALGLLVVGCAGYQLGKRCGFWKGYRHGADDAYRRERGCRDDDGYWRHESDRYDDDRDRYHHHHDRYDGDLLDWALQGNDERYRFGGRDGGQTCEFGRREDDRREHMDVCTYGTDDRRMMEWNNREEDCRYIQVVQDPPRDHEHERPRTFEALETLIDGSQVFMVLEDGLPEMGDFGGNFPAFASLVNRTLGSLNDVLEVESNDVVSARYYMEPLDETAEEDARALLDGYYERGCQFYRLVRDVVGPETCSQIAEFMLPYQYDSNRDSNVDLDMHLYQFCMGERGTEAHPYKK